MATIQHNLQLQTHSWIDYSVSKPTRFDPTYLFKYKERAVNQSSKASLYSNELVILGTGGIWKPNFNEETLNKYSLEQNYPNPFNPSTKINSQSHLL